MYVLVVVSIVSLLIVKLYASPHLESDPEKLKKISSCTPKNVQACGPIK